MQLLQRVPAAGVWHVLSPGIVRLMLNHTQGEENYLFSLVKMTLQQLPSVVQDDQEARAVAFAAPGRLNSFLVSCLLASSWIQCIAMPEHVIRRTHYETPARVPLREGLKVRR